MVGVGVASEKSEKVQSVGESTFRLWPVWDRTLTHRKKVKAKLCFSESGLGGLEF